MAKAKKQTKPQRPVRDEFELEEIAYQLTEAFTEKTEVVLSVWKVGEPIQGKVTKMDGQTKLIHVEEKYGDVKKVPFVDILAVSSVSA
ncbi:YolD-like family protein [Pseudobacillus sp. 179-B 2D1 NHS]|uniref:YolD-like family protein n=1 Tax=Pseudobacillus sp. 179-B 2D1 NHS TaxID=3374292 RepID=UPI00387A6D5E